MLLRINDIRSYYKELDLNHWHCPTCIKGILKLQENDLNFKQSKYSLRKKPIGEDKEGVFTGILVCSQETCSESVTVSGSYQMRKTKDGKIRHYYPYYFFPAIPIFNLNDFEDDVSSEVLETIETAFELFWIDPNSCANKIRVAIETLLTDKRIPKYDKRKNGKRRRLSTHDRIEIYRERNPSKSSIANKLMALKWIGNDGSHADDELDQEEVFKGFYILYHTMYHFTDAEKTLDGLVNDINKRHSGRY